MPVFSRVPVVKPFKTIMSLFTYKEKDYFIFVLRKKISFIFNKNTGIITDLNYFEANLLKIYFKIR